MRIGLREANQQFSKAMRAVRAGEEVILTERGKPVAVIKPLDGSDTPRATIRRLEMAGFLRAGVITRVRLSPSRLDLAWVRRSF